MACMSPFVSCELQLERWHNIYLIQDTASDTLSIQVVLVGEGCRWPVVACGMNKFIRKLGEVRFSNTTFMNMSQHYKQEITVYNQVSATCRIIEMLSIRYNILSLM